MNPLVRKFENGPIDFEATAMLTAGSEGLLVKPDDLIGLLKLGFNTGLEEAARQAENTLRTHHQISGDYCDCIPDHIRICKISVVDRGET